MPEVPSTNTWLLDALSRNEPIEEETVVYTMCQTQGRGQVGNTWESEPGFNIAFSLLLRPSFWPIRSQFTLSQLCCLGIFDGLSSLCKGADEGDAFLSKLCIKWPNDIYVGDKKLGGMLIENRIMNGTLSECVLGVGLNVNQTVWRGDAPNPTSLLLQGLKYSPEQVLAAATEGITDRYHLFKQNPETYGARIHDDFVKHLYRKEGVFDYVDAQTGKPFRAEIAGVDPAGPLLLNTTDGECLSYWFKEVKFVLPCGVIKE